MAFDNPGLSPEIQKPEVQEPPTENREANVEVAQEEQVPSTIPSQDQPPVSREASPQQVHYVEEPVMHVQGAKDPGLQRLEGVLATPPIVAAHAKMSPEDQEKVRIKGEETARRIFADINAHRLRPHRVLKDIQAWLHTMPKFEYWFLEQEGKRILDGVQTFAENREKESGNVM